MLESYLSTAGVVLPFLLGLLGNAEDLVLRHHRRLAAGLRHRRGPQLPHPRPAPVAGTVHPRAARHAVPGAALYFFPSSGIAWLHWDSATAAFVSLSVYVLLRGRDHPGRHRGRAARPDRGRHDAGPETLADPAARDPAAGVAADRAAHERGVRHADQEHGHSVRGRHHRADAPGRGLHHHLPGQVAVHLRHDRGHLFPVLLIRRCAWPTGWKAAGRRPARRQPQPERTPPSIMPTEYVDTYYKRTLSDPQPAIRPWPARKAPRSAWWAALAGLSVALELARRGRQVTLLEGSRIAWAPRAATAARSRPRSRPAPTPSAAMWTRSITARFTGCRWRAWRSSAPTSATWTSATPTRSTAACAWCATTPATRCSAGAMNSSGSSSATCACCRAPSCASGW